MKLTVEAFRAWDHKCVTLLGMSGVGKTRLSVRPAPPATGSTTPGTTASARATWTSRSSTSSRARPCRCPFLRDLLRSDWIFIRNNITVDDLGPVLSFVGKLGNPELGGLPLEEFNRRQALHRQAEIAAMMDVPEFIRKAPGDLRLPPLGQRRRRFPVRARRAAG